MAVNYTERSEQQQLKLLIIIFIFAKDYTSAQVGDIRDLLADRAPLSKVLLVLYLMY